MEAGQELYFLFRSVSGGVAQYRQEGGTRLYSEMAGLGMEQRLRYVHQHAKVTLDQAEADTERKHGKRAAELLARAERAKGAECLQLLNLALVTAPPEQEDWIAGVRERIAGVLSELNLRGAEHAGPATSCISSKVKVVYTAGAGRHVLAREDIAAGEEIVSEAPAVAFLHHAARATNCHHCCRAVLAAAPCPRCSCVMFCGEECRRAAERYHGTECGHMHLVPGLGTLAPVLRLATSRTAEFFMERAGYFDHYDKTSEKTVSEYQDDFDALFNLEAGNKSDSQYNILKAANAYYLLCLLKKMKYFTNNDPSTLHEEHLTVARFLDHFLRVADSNCHEVCELDTPATTAGKTFDELFDSEDSAVAVVGVAIYPTMSLFNNSCDVNTLKYHAGTTETMLARRNIRAGEEIADFYGEYYFQNTRLTRKKNLGFPCGCPPCRGDWPLLEQLPGFSYEEVEERYDWAVQRVALESALAHTDVETVRNICLELDSLVKVTSPHQATVTPELYLSYAFLFLRGNSSNKFKLFQMMKLKSLTENK